ncbi:MAG: glycoside hydrolase family 38 C-terminal domain-containing protein, partial [bacterium]
MPSSESLIRQILYGHQYFKKEFGTESAEFMLPDCFGFPASLPSILSHCGIKGFSTQKLSWGSAVGIPFDIGRWEGPDGNSVIAALNPGCYVGSIGRNMSGDGGWLGTCKALGDKTGLYALYHYYGTGDQGGAPDENSAKWVEASATSEGPLKVVSSRADQMFRDVSDAQKAKLDVYKGDLLLTQHSAGSISSAAYMKRWNRMNEVLADAAEKASVAAHLLGSAPYPREQLFKAWGVFLGAQFHDILPGTSVPKAYEYSLNDEVIALNTFASALTEGISGVARGLDTRVAGIPLVVFNPLSIERQDPVEASLALAEGVDVQVYDAAGKPVPTQILGRTNGTTRILFQARVPSVGMAVFSAVAGKPRAVASGLSVTPRAVENARYRVTINEAGDIASVFDKSAKREILSAPSRWVFTYENPGEYPAWNMDWSDRKQPPRGYVEGPAQIRVVENGPVRVALEVERQAFNSTFIQTIRLAGGSAGERVEVSCKVAWQTRERALRAEFPLTVSNPLATY